MKLAITHDYLNQYGGAERIIEDLHKIWPSAPIYTSVYDKGHMKELGFRENGTIIFTSFMQHFPFLRILPKYYYTFFYPIAFHHFNFKGYDTILSVSSYAAKDIRKPSGSIHVAYINTPPRFLYGYDQETNISKMNYIERHLAAFWKIYLLSRDQKSVARVDYIIANSENVKKRIKKSYNRESVVIYPPVDTARFAAPSFDGGYFLIVSRLGEYKKVDLVVKAFNNLGLPLKVVGTGPQLAYLKQIAHGNVAILERLDDDKVRDLFLGCRAFVFPTEEDFGIAPVEAMAAGKAVICFGKGGAAETVVDGKTGIFFHEQSVAAIEDAVRGFNPNNFSETLCRLQAQKFDRKVFQREIKSFVEKCYSGKIG